jgi:VanZ family protein
MHLLTYFLFAVLGYRVVATPKGFVRMAAGVAAYSGLMEIAQSLNPERMTSIADFGANLLGVLVAFVLLKSSTPFRNFVGVRA